MYSLFRFPNSPKYLDNLLSTLNSSAVPSGIAKIAAPLTKFNRKYHTTIRMINKMNDNKIINKTSDILENSLSYMNSMD